uniref:hypothetical protein n=1 Tax=Enterocloster clostridioformis TaxID=1531 RepID=UPI0034E8D22A
TKAGPIVPLRFHTEYVEKKKYESLLIKSQSETNKTIQKGVLREFLDAYSCPVPVVKHLVFQAAKQPLTGGIVRGASGFVLIVQYGSIPSKQSTTGER